MDFVKASFRDAVIENGYMWVFDNRIQAMCKINLEDFALEILCIYSGGERVQVQNIFLFQDKFYLTLVNSLKILVFDRKIKNSMLAFGLEKPVTDSKSKKYRVFFYDKKIYFFLRNADVGEVICFDIATRKYIAKKLFGESIRKKVGNRNLFGSFFNCYRGTVWFTITNTKFYASYSLSDERIDLFENKSGNTVLNSCCYDGHHIWLTEKDNSNIICAGEQVIHISDKQSYLNMISFEEGIIALSNHYHSLVFVERKTLKATIVNVPSQEDSPVIVGWREYEEEIFLFPLYTGDMYAFNKRTGNIKRIDIRCANYIEAYIRSERALIKEDKYVNLERLLQFCKKKSEFIGTRHGREVIAGRSIWDAVR